MGKAKLGQRKKTLSYEEKQEKLERRYTEWTGNEVVLKYAWIEFKLEQATRRNSKYTMDFYDRFYKKLKAHYDTLTDGNGEQMPVEQMVSPEAQLLFTMSLGNVKDVTVNSYLRGYRAFGNFCEEKGYIKDFECPIKKVEPEIKQVYTEKELQALLKKPSLENFVEFRDYTIISVILATGARCQTILNLKINDVDFDTGYIHFNTTKTNKTIRLQLPEQTKLDLMMYIDRWRNFEDTKLDEYLFCSDSEDARQLSRRGLCKTISWYNKKRGVQKTSIHLLRHTFAKNWITSGGDIISLANVLTHSELDMVKRYSNLYSEDVGKKIMTHSIINTLPRESNKSMKAKKK